MCCMALDHPRLADALRQARRARRWSQAHVAEVAEQLGYGQLLSRTTIQRYERATPFESVERVSTTLAAFERVYGWTPGSCIAVLEGGDPTPLDAGEGVALDSAPGAEQLPIPVRIALEFGQLLDYDVYTEDVDGEEVKVISLAVTSSEAVEALQRQLDRFGQIKGYVRRKADPTEGESATEVVDGSTD